MANPRLKEGSKRRKRKDDRIDANKLARLGRGIYSRCTRWNTAARKCGRIWRCYELAMRWWECGLGRQKQVEWSALNYSSKALRRSFINSISHNSWIGEGSKSKCS